MFVAANVVIGVMIVVLDALRGASPAFSCNEGLHRWQHLLFVVVIPISADFESVRAGFGSLQARSACSALERAQLVRRRGTVRLISVPPC
jgi:hypothetical protein